MFVFFAGDVSRSPGETPEKPIMNSTIHYCPENYHPIQYKQWSHPIIIIIPIPLFIQLFPWADHSHFLIISSLHWYKWYSIVIPILEDYDLPIFPSSHSTHDSSQCKQWADPPNPRSSAGCGSSAAARESWLYGPDRCPMFFGEPSSLLRQCHNTWKANLVYVCVMFVVFNVMFILFV